MDCIRYGPDALLLRFAERIGDDAFRRGQVLAAELEKNPPPGLREWIPAFTTLLLEFAPGQAPEPSQLLGEFEARMKHAKTRLPPVPAPLEIPVVYDGPDLER